MKRIAPILAAALAAMIPSRSWADGQYKLLVLVMPGKYHYEFVPIARDSLERMAKLHAFEITWAGNAEALNQNLQQYQAVMLLNTPTEDLNAVQRGNFEAYMRTVGTHPML
jgi:uncharacterized protein